MGLDAGEGAGGSAGVGGSAGGGEAKGGAEVADVAWQGVADVPESAGSSRPIGGGNGGRGCRGEDGADAWFGGVPGAALVGVGREGDAGAEGPLVKVRIGTCMG